MFNHFFLKGGTCFILVPAICFPKRLSESQHDSSCWSIPPEPWVVSPGSFKGGPQLMTFQLYWLVTHRIHGSGIFTYIWLIFTVKCREIYQSHGLFGLVVILRICLSKSLKKRLIKSWLCNFDHSSLREGVVPR